MTVAPAVAQPDRLLYIHPEPSVLERGQSVEVTAWFCRVLPGGDDFGADGNPGTDDDRCERARATVWKTEDPTVARVRPRRGASTTITGRREGLTTLEARFQATSTAAFARLVSVDVREPLPEPGPGEPEPDAGPVPGLDVTIVVDPPVAVLAPGDEQLFVAYVCPLLGDVDPRGRDTVPGSLDDFCRPAVATWSLAGEPVLGSLDPKVDVVTRFHADADEDETGMVGRVGQGSLSQTSTMSNTIRADIGGQQGGAGIVVDPNLTGSDAPKKGDVDGDGDVDLDDISAVVKRRGQPAASGDDPADLDGDGRITVLDTRGAVLLCDLPGCETP
jgi:hypothetical protein